MRKKLILLILALLLFVSGFLTHALFFPDFLSGGLSDLSQIVVPNPTPTGVTKLRDLVNTITYDGEHFSRHTMSIEVGTYLAVKNTSPDKLMWLNSNNPAFITPRGFGESEVVQYRMDAFGKTVIEAKNNPLEKVVVTVR